MTLTQAEIKVFNACKGIRGFDSVDFCRQVMKYRESGNVRLLQRRVALTSKKNALREMNKSNGHIGKARDRSYNKRRREYIDMDKCADTSTPEDDFLRNELIAEIGQNISGDFDKSFELLLYVRYHNPAFNVQALRGYINADVYAQFINPAIPFTKKAILAAIKNREREELRRQAIAAAKTLFPTGRIAL